MRRVLILTALLLTAATVGAAAVAPGLHSFIKGVEDYDVAESPCAPLATLQVTPYVFDGRVWSEYLCADSRVVMRRFEASVVEPEPVPPPTPAIVCPSGFVHTRDGQGCVPPNHPLAGGR